MFLPLAQGIAVSRAHLHRPDQLLSRLFHICHNAGAHRVGHAPQRAQQAAIFGCRAAGSELTRMPVSFVQSGSSTYCAVRRAGHGSPRPAGSAEGFRWAGSNIAGNNFQEGADHVGTRWISTVTGCCRKHALDAGMGTISVNAIA